LIVAAPDADAVTPLRRDLDKLREDSGQADGGQNYLNG
jgi:hypothetical protein